MTNIQLAEAQKAREDKLLDTELDRVLDVTLSADAVSPEARNKLKALLKHYAKKPHPFRSCVRDNVKRFGPGRTEAVCATLKDMIRGTTQWRSNPDLDQGSTVALSDDEKTVIFSELTDEDWAHLESVVLSEQA